MIKKFEHERNDNEYLHNQNNTSLSSELWGSLQWVGSLHLSKRNLTNEIDTASSLKNLKH